MDLDQKGVDFLVGVILPAAGCSQRLGNSIPKQYMEINGKSLFLYSVEIFEKIPWVSTIVLVSDDVMKMQNILANRNAQSVGKVTVVKGGSTRHQSIQAGLSALQGLKTAVDVIVVHDAVRPIVPHCLLTQVVLAAYETGAAGPTRPLISTVVSCDQHDFLTDTLDRSKYFNSETPQAFRTTVLSQAYRKISQEELQEGTECLKLVSEHCNVRAKLIKGPEELWKVTLKRDLHSAVGCISAASIRVCVLSPAENSEVVNTKVIPLTTSSLQWRVAQIDHIPQNQICCSNGHLKSYNTAIIFHGAGQENVCVPLTTLLDSNIEGIIIHIILQPYTIQDKPNLYTTGQKVLHDHTHVNKLSVVIYWNDVEQYETLIQLISNVVLSGKTFGNQILFT